MEPESRSHFWVDFCTTANLLKGNCGKTKGTIEMQHPGKKISWGGLRKLASSCCVGQLLSTIISKLTEDPLLISSVPIKLKKMPSFYADARFSLPIIRANLLCQWQSDWGVIILHWSQIHEDVTASGVLCTNIDITYSISYFSVNFFWDIRHVCSRTRRKKGFSVNTALVRRSEQAITEPVFSFATHSWTSRKETQLLSQPSRRAVSGTS